MDCEDVDLFLSYCHMLIEDTLIVQTPERKGNELNNVLRTIQAANLDFPPFLNKDTTKKQIW